MINDLLKKSVFRGVSLESGMTKGNLELMTEKVLQVRMGSYCGEIVGVLDSKKVTLYRIGKE